MPRIMLMDETIDLMELVEIIQAKAKNRVISITEFEPTEKYLLLYVGMDIIRGGFKNTLFLHLSNTCTEKYGSSLALVKNFGKFRENDLIYDAIRCTLNEFIVREEGQHTMYFQEFITDSNGEYLSILKVIIGIFQSFSYHISDKDHKTAMFQRLTEFWEN
ncbi:MAG: hypothetical protein NTU98_08275 [Bacteroidetes bacterium]|nr:hypothetical protein [Bacteroidota bacterium]